MSKNLKIAALAIGIVLFIVGAVFLALWAGNMSDDSRDETPVIEMLSEQGVVAGINDDGVCDADMSSVKVANGIKTAYNGSILSAEWGEADVTVKLSDARAFVSGYTVHANGETVPFSITLTEDERENPLVMHFEAVSFNMLAGEGEPNLTSITFCASGM